MKKIITAALFLCLLLTAALPAYALPEVSRGDIGSKPVVYKESSGMPPTRPTFIQTSTTRDLPSKIAVVDSSMVSVKYDLWIVRFVKKLFDGGIF